MSSLQVATFIAIPISVIVVAVVLIAFARPDRDDGVYASYLALASLLSLYIVLISLAGLGEAIGQHLAVGGQPESTRFTPDSVQFVYYAMVGEGGATAAFALGTLAVLMGASWAFHARRRSELRAGAAPDGSVLRVDRAYAGAVCFTMLTLVTVGAVLAGAAGYQFFHEPVASSDRFRDVAMAALLSYGGLVLVAGLIFRTHFWAIRGNDESADPEVTVAELGDG